MRKHQKKALIVLILVAIIYGYILVSNQKASPITLNFKETLSDLLDRYNAKHPPQRNAEKIPNQFSSNNHLFKVISHHNTPYHQRPTENCRILGYLPITQRVRSHHVIDDWHFVTDYTGTKDIGWVEEKYLLGPQDFEPLKSWYKDTITFKWDSFTFTKHMKPNGRFQTLWVAEGNQLILKGKINGQLHQSGDILWAKKDSPEIWEDFFYINTKDQIMTEIIHDHIPISTIKD